MIAKGYTRAHSGSESHLHRRPHFRLSHLARPETLLFMRRTPAILWLTVVLAVPAGGCLVRSYGPPERADGRWRGGPPPGQVRRAEVHQRNEERKEARDHGHHERDAHDRR